VHQLFITISLVLSAMELVVVPSKLSQTGRATSHVTSRWRARLRLPPSAVRTVTSDCSGQLPALLLLDAVTDDKRNYVSCAAGA